MSQRMSQVDVQLQGHQVTQHIHSMQQRDDAMLQNLKVCKDAVLDTAGLYVEEKDQAKLEQLRAQLLQLVETEQQVQHHRAALAQVQAGYQPTLEATDFAASIQQHMQQAEAARPFHAERDEAVNEFDEIAGAAGGGGGAGAGEEELLDEDEDLVVVGSVVKNDRCPYTRKDVSQLDDPLEDQEGFIYEGSAIRAALQQAAREHMNWIECPLPGVSHRIMLFHLKPANKRRLQRLARARQAATQAAPGGVVLDV